MLVPSNLSIVHRNGEPFDPNTGRARLQRQTYVMSWYCSVLGGDKREEGGVEKGVDRVD